MGDAMDVKLNYVDGMEFLARTPSGHQLTLDAAPKYGGRDKGPRPSELLLVGLGGCSAMDVISILKKKKLDVTGFEINVKGLRAEEHPKRFTEIELEYVVKGKNIPEEAVRKAVELSMNKYCSVKATLEEGAKVKFGFRVENE